LSLNNEHKRYKFTSDSTLNQRFSVHEADSTTRVFRPSRKGLFFYDVKKDVAHVLVDTV